MNPVRGLTMLNFLHWVALHRPDVKSLRHLSETELLRLANEFEHGKLTLEEQLKWKWQASFNYLLHTDSDWEGYGVARQELDAMELRRGQGSK